MEETFKQLTEEKYPYNEYDLDIDRLVTSTERQAYIEGLKQGYNMAVPIVLKEASGVENYQGSYAKMNQSILSLESQLLIK